MNYAELFRVTLPETALEVAALLVLVVDLGLLRKAALKVRVAVAALLGVAGCGAALWAVLRFCPCLVGYGYVPVAQTGILVLTALTLFLMIDSVFTKHVGEYVAVVLMAAIGGLLIAMAQDLLVIFIGLELLSLGLYILTAFAKSSAKSAEAALKYYLFGGMSAAFLLFGFSYLYGLSGSTNLHEIIVIIASSQGSASAPLLYIALALIAAGLGFKIAAVPFHLWAADTYEGAPAPAAAFIASVSKVASFTLLISFSTVMLFERWNSMLTQAISDRITSGFSDPWSLTWILFAAASMIVGNLAALAQVSVRRLLAYSAIAHAGYILLGVAFYPGYSGHAGVYVDHPLRPVFVNVIAVLYYVLTYGLTTIGAFGVVDVVQRATGSDRFDVFLGLHKRNPALAAVLLVLFLSLAGIPPLVGFWAKFNLFAAVLGVSPGGTALALVALAVALSAVSLYYYIQVLKRAYVMPAVDETPIKVHPVTMIVLVGIAAAVVLLGMFPAVLQGWIAGFYPVV